MPNDPAPTPGELYETAPCGLLLADSRGKLLRVNATLCRWLRYERAQLLDGMRFQDLLTMGGRIFHQTHLMPLLRMQGSVGEVKLEFRLASGATVPMVINASEQLHAGEPHLQVACFLAEDRHRYEKELLAQRRRAEELAAQVAGNQGEIAAARAQAEDRALFAEQMVGIVSHDLRNPLSAILMGVAVLQRGQLGAPQRAVLDRMSRSGYRSARLISDLLDFTRARLGKGLQLNQADHDLDDVVAEAMHELTLAFPERVIRHIRNESGPCHIDADRVTQALGNLVANAVSYGAAGTEVTVTTTRCRIDVHNHGEPIPADKLQSLFEPMVRGAGESTAGARGVGLGLYIVREIARAHGGEVDVRSDAQGTVFSIKLTGPSAQASR